MALKLIHATGIRKGQAIMIDDKPCIVQSTDTSRPGKHGHAKVRIKATGIFDGKNKVVAVPGHDRFNVPEILKSRAQVLSIQGDDISIMDLDNYKTMNVDKIEEGVKEELKENDNVEYWDVEGERIIKRKT